MQLSARDLAVRIKSLIPTGWFGDSAPVLDSLLSALSGGWMAAFALLEYSRLQARIKTATEIWLDMAAADFFGGRISRRQDEGDEDFRGRIVRELFRERVTRSSVERYLVQLTGRNPIIFEPANPADTGCYGGMTPNVIGVAGYGVSGGWGSYGLPFQFFLQAFRENSTLFAGVNGWNGGFGGFGDGASSYIDAISNGALSTDSEIIDGVASTIPAGGIAWMTIVS